MTARGAADTPCSTSSMALWLIDQGVPVQRRLWRTAVELYRNASEIV